MRFTFKVGKVHASIPGSDSLIHLTDIEITSEVEPEYLKQGMENLITLIKAAKEIYEFSRDELLSGNIKDIKTAIDELDGGASCGKESSEESS